MTNQTDTLHCYKCGKVSLYLMKRILVNSRRGRVVSSKVVYICSKCRLEEG